MTKPPPFAPDFLETDAVLFLHDQALREYGGVHGVKSDHLLASALARPANRLSYVAAVDVFDLAAAYAFGMARDHPFNDGNKRTAWGCCVLFLVLNGLCLRVAAAEAVEQVVSLAAGTTDEAGFAIWLRRSATTVA